MINRFMLLDTALALHFLFLFPRLHEGYEWLGVIVALLFLARIVKEILPPPDKGSDLPADTRNVQERVNPLEHPPAGRRGAIASSGGDPSVPVRRARRR